MSRDIFTFYNYIQTNNTVKTQEFVMTFGDRVYNLPERVVSSRCIAKLLNITTRREFGLFRDVFTDYYKVYITNT